MYVYKLIFIISLVVIVVTHLIKCVFEYSDAEIIDLLVQIFEEGELKVDAGGKGLNLTGFNTFC